MKSRSVYVSSAGGPKLHLSEWAGKEGDCILVRGFGEGSYIWNDLARRLSPSTRVMAIDLRGHGESDWDENSKYSTRVHADDVISVIEAVKITRFILVGHSLGAEIALRITSLWPQRVAGLVLADFGIDVDPQMSAHVLAEFKSETKIYSSVSEYVTLLQMKRPLAESALLQQFAANALRPLASGGFELKRDPALGYEENFEFETDPALWKMLGQILCPVLLVRGVGSAILSPMLAARMKDAIADCRLELIRMSGHSVMLDNPDDFSDVVQGFVQQVSKRCLLDNRRMLPRSAP
jgi:pimeloyl-ACP methyl ester carboxylesterase